MNSNLPIKKAINYLTVCNEKNIKEFKKLINIFPKLVDIKIEFDTHLSYQKKTLLALAIEKAIQFHFVENEEKYQNMLSLIDFLIEKNANVNASIQETDHIETNHFTILGISTTCQFIFNHLIQYGARMNESEYLYFKDKISTTNTSTSLAFNNEVKKYLVLHEREKLEKVISNNEKTPNTKIKI